MCPQCVSQKVDLSQCQGQIKHGQRCSRKVKIEHWLLHEAERGPIRPRQGDFPGTDDQLFAAYREAYKDLDHIKVDVVSLNGTHVLDENVTPRAAVDLIENWLKESGLR